MKIEGGCHCGAVAYEAEVDPANVGICHCTDCQQLSGSPYRVTLPTPTQNFHLTRGMLKTYVKTGDSGTKRAQTFCPECGSPIYAANPDKPPTVSLRWGSIRERDELPPRRMIWCGSAAPFAMNLSDIPGVDAQR
ncbi:MAG: GFA family protein [Alphaproteobacteria bacterium]|nr:GFA family protein [Alphaproteobacteria bacterium]MBL6939114.1 GFA family protein [Alphaproteobacteria bacterium]MBL7096631.1 GFA family protein [Alphaproteobacteria bacterium]